MSGVLTARQREVLEARLARAIVWQRATAFERDTAKTLARHLVAEMDGAAVSAPTIRRAVLRVAEHAEQAS